MNKLARTKSLSSILCLLALLGSFYLPTLADDTLEGSRVELPENSRVRIVNRRGGIRLEVWRNSYVSVLTKLDGAAPKVSPVRIARTADQLLVNVPAPLKSAGGARRLDLIIRIPQRSKVSAVTGDGDVVISGVPSELNVLTKSGNIDAEIPESASVDIRGISLKGSAKTAVPSSKSTRPLSSPTLAKAQVFYVTQNGGQYAIELRSTTGNINLSRAANSPDKGESTTARNDSVEKPRARRIGPPALHSEQSLPNAPAGTPAPATAEQDIDEGDVVRVDTQLVTMNVSVVERDTNRGLADLTARDFRLFENGTPQNITSFESSSAPFNMFLLIDLSGSTKEVVRLIREAALRFVDATRPGDRIAVITFANTPVIVSPLTADRELLRERINGIQEPSGSTRLYDSVKFTLDEVAKQAGSARRNAVILMSDGLDSTFPNVKGEGSKLDFRDLIGEVNEFDGVLYSLWLDTEYDALSPEDVQPETVDLAHDRMQELADAGGGAFYEVEKLQDLAGAYERVVADLGTVYSIGYQPSNHVRDGKWRTIKVDVLRPNAVARGKHGYYAK
jgi:Ca-activated chloride channel family protein